MMLIIIFLLINACSSTVQKSWDCPIQNGGTCKTIKEIDYGYIKTGKPKNIKYSKNYQNIKQDFNSFEDLRLKETIGRVVFAPYIDKAGNRHDISRVYYIDFSSEWIK